MTVGYIVSTWPSLSQTFVLNEIMALERFGLEVRIFSIKDPRQEPVHERLALVRADVTYLSITTCWKRIVQSNLLLACQVSGHYFRTLFRALRYRRKEVTWAFFQAGYLAHALRQHPVAHLHAHFATAPAMVAMFASELTRTAYSFTAHARDIYVDTHPEMMRAEIRCAKAVVTVSEYNRKHLTTRSSPGDNGKVRCIYNGLDLDRFPFPLTASFHARTPVILSVARLVEKKGLGDLIEATRILRDRGYSFRAEIIGDGPLFKTLLSRVKELGLDDRVTLLGAQPQEAVLRAYQRAVIFGLPCIVTAEGDRDGIPTVLLEAMASGVVVVSTSVSGIPELIDTGRDGLLVEPHNPSMLAQAIERLLIDPGLRDCMARAARAKIEQRFSIDRSSRQLLSLFQTGGVREDSRALV